MKATLWHNPSCGTSRKALALLRDRGCTVQIIPYLTTTPSRAKLAQLIADAGLTPQRALRLRGTDAQARGLPDASDEAVLEAMAADPRLIERPFVETAKGARLARPIERLNDIL